MSRRRINTTLTSAEWDRIVEAVNLYDAELQSREDEPHPHGTEARRRRVTLDRAYEHLAGR